jgi:hypothetical protein
MIIQKHSRGVPVFYTGVATFFFGFFSLVVAIMVSGCGATSECSGLFCIRDIPQDTLASSVAATSDDDAVSFDLSVKASGIAIDGQMEFCLDAECTQIDQAVSFTTTDQETYSAAPSSYPVGFNGGLLTVKVSLNLDATPFSESISWTTTSSQSENRSFLLGLSCDEVNTSACEEVYYSNTLSISSIDKTVYPAIGQLRSSMQAVKLADGSITSVNMANFSGTATVKFGSAEIAGTDNFTNDTDADGILVFEFPYSESGNYTALLDATFGSISVSATASQYLSLEYVSSSYAANVQAFYADITSDSALMAPRQFQIIANLDALYTADNAAISESWTASLNYTIYSRISGTITDVTNYYDQNNLVAVNNSAPDIFILDITIPRAEPGSITVIIEGTATLADVAESASSCFEYISLSAGSDSTATKQIGMVAQVSDHNGLTADLTTGYSLTKAYLVLNGESKAEAVAAINMGTRQMLEADVKKVADNHVITTALSTGQLAVADRVLYILEKRDSLDQLESRRAILVNIPTFSFNGIIRDLGALSLRVQTGSTEAEQLANEVGSTDALSFRPGVDPQF